MRVLRLLVLASLLGILAFLTNGCRGLSDVNVPPQPISLKRPVSKRVIVIMFENQKLEGVQGNANAPYINRLLSTMATADNYYADTHPSLGNYFMMTTGDIISNDLNFADTVTQNNLARELGQAGVTWKAYAESIPKPGYLGDAAYPYVKSHNPFAYFSDIRMIPTTAQQMVPLTQLQADLDANQLPAFVYIVPDQTHNMHDCEDGTRNCDNDAKLATGDAWLQDIVGQIQASAAWNQTETTMIITWDESWDNDSRNGGGHVPFILLGKNVKTGYHSQAFYQHESLLNLICAELTLPCDLKKGQSAPPMDEFFTVPPSAQPTEPQRAARTVAP